MKELAGLIVRFWDIVEVYDAKLRDSEEVGEMCMCVCSIESQFGYEVGHRGVKAVYDEVDGYISRLLEMI